MRRLLMLLLLCGQLAPALAQAEPPSQPPAAPDFARAGSSEAQSSERSASGMPPLAPEIGSERGRIAPAPLAQPESSLPASRDPSYFDYPQQPIVPALVEPEVVPPNADRPGTLPVLPPAELPAVSAQPKPALSWRSLATRLTLDEAPAGRFVKISLPYDDAFMALLSVCAQSGFVVQSLNSDAGHVLASSRDNARTQLVFSAFESGGATEIRGDVYGEKSPAKTEALSTILKRLSTYRDTRGSI